MAKGIRAPKIAAISSIVSGPPGSRRTKLRGTVRRNRALLIALLAVAGVVALLTGISLAVGEWANEMHGGVRTLNTPEPRFGYGSAFNPDKQEVLLFGGFVATTPTGVGGLGGPPIETWGDTRIFRRSDSYGNAFWQGRSPLASPSRRGFTAIAYDGARRNAVLFGGGLYRSNTVFGDTWTWENDQWTLRHPVGPTPAPRQNHAMVYDAHRKVVVLFGGRNAAGQPLNDTWTWDGKQWTEMILPPDAIPKPRYGHAMAYDLCNAETVIFGGVGAPDPPPTDNALTQNPNFPRVHSVPRETWTWSGNNWTQHFPVTPPGRIGAGMDYSSRTGRVLLYGGLAVNEAGVVGAAADTDVWRWERALNTWEKLASEASPAGVIGAIGDANATRHSPPPRGYGMFLHDQIAFVGGAAFKIFGGTPAPATPQYGSGNDPQYAAGDDYSFHEWNLFSGAAERRDNLGSLGTNQARENAGLLRECAGPVPLPEEGEEIQVDDGEKEPSEPVSTGMEEVDPPGDPVKQNEECLAARSRAREGMPVEWPCVLTGTDWPGNQRNTHAFSGNPRPANPDYTPRPECPNSGNTAALITDQKRNRAYQFFACDPDTGYQNSPANGTYYQSLDEPPTLLIQVHDGATLEVLARRVVRSAQFDLFHDTERGRFLLKNSYWNGSTTVTELVVIRQDLLEKGIDPVVSRTQIGPPITTSGTANWFVHPKSRRIKLFYVGPSVPAASPRDAPGYRIVQYDLESKKDDWQVALSLPDCKAGAPGIYFSTITGPLFQNGEWMYASCLLSNGNYAVVRVALETDPADSDADRPKLDAAGNAVVEVYPGYSRGPLRWNDPGSERVLLQQSYQQKVWVFDGKSARYVGLATIGLHYSVQFGFDDHTGRLYAHRPDYVQTGYSNSGKEPGGVMLVDTRLTPVPQPVKFSQFTSFPAIPVSVLPASDGAPRRIITRRAAGTMNTYPDGIPKQFENELFYRVISDNIPIPGETQLAELDKLTLGIPETPGKTEAFFDAQGSGYGIRLRSAGGIWSTLRFADTTEGEALLFRNDLPFKPLLPSCLFPDRELMAGWVSSASLSDLDAVARSSGLEVDSNSKVDLIGPTSRCNPPATPATFHSSVRPVIEILWPLWQLAQFQANQAAGYGSVSTGKDADGNTASIDTPLGTLQQGTDEDGNPTIGFQAPTSTSWAEHFKQVECVGDAATEYQANAGNIYSQARCVKQRGLVEATARGSAAGTGPTGSAAADQGFSVGEGFSKVSATRDPVKGVVVNAYAVARNIELPGLAIDRVETIAEVWSSGRPSDDPDVPRASFIRRICGVTTPDYSNGRCLTAKEQNDLVNGWNSGWGGRSKMFLPKPDPAFYEGSAGGYIAGVIKPLSDTTEDQLISRDSMREIPGLVIVFFKDSVYQGPASQAIYLAGVRAVAGLGVQCNTELVFSPKTNSCVEMAFEEDPVEFEEEFTEEEFSEFEDLDSGLWTAPDAAGSLRPSLASRIGRFIENLPVISRLPIREIGEALLAWSVWLLLSIPLLLAWRRLNLNFGGSR